MRPIDATELFEDMMRADVSSREKIAAIIKKQPTIKGIETNKMINHFRRLSNEYMQKSEHYKGMALAYSTAADSIMLAMEEGDIDAES
jgi:hypothetical protein